MFRLTPFVLLVGALSSCVYDSAPVPEMPYTPRTYPTVQPIQQPMQQPVTTTNTWGQAIAPVGTAPALTPMPVGYTPVPTAPTMQPTAPHPALPPVVRQAPVQPVVQPASAKPSTHITQSYTPPALTPPPAQQPPAVTTVTPPSPAGESTTPSDPKLITNTGPIPVAMRVEGDPIRVYNPLDPTKTIRIIDPKTGKVHPSGKVLKVKGTNFKFIVP